MTPLAARPAQRGLNLVELIVAIVIISIASAGVLLVYAQAVRFSADPLIQQQALAIAEAYLDEILARDWQDPPAGAGELGGPGSPEEPSRDLYDDIQDYWGLDESPPRDQDGTVADFAPADGRPDLEGYRVNVLVTPNVAINGVPMAQVDVRVRYDYGGANARVDLTLTGYRAQ